MAREVIKAPITGSVWLAHFNAGDHLKVGDTVLTMEAMKMELPIESTLSGIIHWIAAAGDSFNEGDDVVIVDTAD